MDANGVARGGGTAGFFVDFGNIVWARLCRKTEKAIGVSGLCNTEGDHLPRIDGCQWRCQRWRNCGLFCRREYHLGETDQVLTGQY